LHCSHSSSIWSAFSFDLVYKSQKINSIDKQSENLIVMKFIAVTFFISRQCCEY
jgi:hypothetical protein